MISDAEHFYSGALGRIRQFMLVLGVAATVIVSTALGWRIGLGVLAGSAIAYVNFHWLKQVCQGPGRSGKPAPATLSPEAEWRPVLSCVTFCWPLLRMLYSLALPPA